MATVNGPSPALNRAVLHSLGHARLYEGEPLSDLWRSLESGLEEAEARALGQSIGLVLRLLAGDTRRVQLAVDLAVAIDAYEAADGILELLEVLPDSQIAVGLAALVSHPGVSGEAERALREHRAVRAMQGPMRRALEIRLDSEAPAESDREHLLRLQRWPGVATDTYLRAPLAPVVAIVEQGLPSRLMWTLVSLLRRHGAAVRRVPSSLVRPPKPGWLGPAVPIIATSSALLTQLRQAGQEVTGSQVVVVDPESATDTHLTEVVKAVDSLLRHLGASGLRYADELAIPGSESEVLEQGIFRLGSYTAPELAYLAGTSVGSVYRWSHELEALSPAQVEGMNYWGFNHLVALRAYYWLQSNVRRRVPRGVLKGLADFAGRAEPGTVAVTLSGEVLVIEGPDDWHAIESGQKVIPEAVRVDRSFQAFRLGSGATVVPGLLEPSIETRVHPAVLGGTPTLKGRRIPCLSLARLANRHGSHAVRAVYPFLSPSQISDGLSIGRGILAK